MTTLDDRKQRTLSKRCTKCGEVKALSDFRKDRRNRDGRDSRCRVCDARCARERLWKKQGVPPEHWPRLHREVDARAARRDSVPDGFKRCYRCDEVKPLEKFAPHESRRDGRQSLCYVCDARRTRERHWKKRGVPPEHWQRLHREADRQQRMRELAAQYGLKYCPSCDMCLGRGFFYRRSASADGLHWCCKACDSARRAAHHRTPAGRASAKGSRHRRRARERSLPTDGTGPREWAAWAEEQDDFLCYLCGGILTAEDDTHWDHVDPISTGSTGTVLPNMRAVHARCNLSRGNRPVEEWRAAMGLSDEIG